METRLSKYWWLMALRGLAAVIFGILAFIWPGITLTVLVLMFGAYALWDGVFSVVAAFRQREENERWWALLLEGMAGIAAGLFTFFWPGLTTLALLYIVAAWAFITGIFEIVAAIRLRKEIEGEWALFLGGLLSALFGLALVFWPDAGLLTIAWLIGGYAVIFGILLIILAFHLRSHRHTTYSSWAA